MRNDFPNTTQVLLEQSYRSTKAILSSSLNLISQGSFCCSKLLSYLEER